MQIKAFFFDIDGTLVSFTTHAIPPSAVRAIEDAHKAGIKIFISTGRPCSIINNLGDIEHLIDGYITMNGAATIVDGRVVASYPLQKTDIEAVLEVARRNDASCVVVGPQSLGFYNLHERDVQTFTKLIGVDISDHGADVEALLRGDVYQLTPFISERAQEDAVEVFEKVEASRWCPYFCDVTAAGVNKGHGVKALCHHFGIPLDAAAAFGDGGNDIPMLREVGIGVAMGNANPEVKAVASFVTGDVDDNGLADAIHRIMAKG